MKGTEGVSGTIHITEADGAVTLVGKIEGLAPGKHGFHIHQLGDTTNGCVGVDVGVGVGVGVVAWPRSKP
jgi:Cu-Zn family superoxide dismutase